MYSVLKDGQIINKDDLIDRFSINERTFYRYIKEIRNFIYEEGVNTNIDLIDEDIIFDKEKDGYILSKREKSNLNEKEILAVSKVLLESRGLIKEELEIILQKILKNCNAFDFSQSFRKKPVGIIKGKFVYDLTADPMFHQIFSVCRSTIRSANGWITGNSAVQIHAPGDHIFSSKF